MARTEHSLGLLVPLYWSHFSSGISLLSDLATLAGFSDALLFAKLPFLPDLRFLPGMPIYQVKFYSLSQNPAQVTYPLGCVSLIWGPQTASRHIQHNELGKVL